MFSTIGKLAGRFGVPESGEPSQAACAWGFAASSDSLVATAAAAGDAERNRRKHANQCGLPHVTFLSEIPRAGA